MAFLNPLFWFGLTALAAPILVHLVRRTRARRVQFPALVFVRQVPQRTIRRRTLHNLLLLLLRCLAILLIVVAFTRPFFTTHSSANSTTSAGATVILVDSSLSMRRGQLFAEAQRRAEAVIDDARNDERLAVVSFGKTYQVISQFAADKTRARTAVSSLGAGWEGTDYEQALRGAESILSGLKTSGSKRIVLISDFQAPGWNHATATFKLASDTQLTTLDVAPADFVPNVAVTDLEARGVTYGQKYSENLAVHIANFADVPKDHVQLEFQINDQTVEKRELGLNSRESKVVEFSNFNVNEGANRCAINIGSNDFEPDNHFYFTLRREVPARALIVESATRGRGDSLYLQSALTTNDELPFSFNLKTAGTIDPASIAEYALVILNDAGSLSQALSNSLGSFVEGGGQLIVSVGPHTDSNNFNASLQKLAPAVLGEPVPPKSDESVAITDVKFEHPIFQIFQESGRLASAHVFGYFRSEPNANAAVLARYEDGSPALVEWHAGKGRVLLFTSTFGPAWNDLALTPIYLPFLHQMVRYVGERDESAWHSLGETFTVSRRNQSTAPPIDTPSGIRLNDVRTISGGDLLLTPREPGFYRLRYESGPEYAAIDTDGTEGDFTKLDFKEFMSGVTGGAGGPEGAGANRNVSNDEIEGRQKVWWSLLLVALILLFSESVLARRTKVAKMVG